MGQTERSGGGPTALLGRIAHPQRRSLSGWSASVFGLRASYRAHKEARTAISRLMAGRRDVERPVFLWGAGRTGSYLLYDLLSLHPELICYRKRARKNKGLYGFEHWGSGDFDSLLPSPFPPMEGVEYHFGAALPRLREGGTLRRDELRQIRQSYRRVVNASIRSRRLLDKSPAYTFLLPVLDEMFPDALHVHCVRHPLAVANGYLRRLREGRNLDSDGIWGWKPDGYEEIISSAPETKAVWLVTRTMQRGLRNEHQLGSRCTRARYEDVVRDPRREVARLFVDLDLDGPPGLLERLPAKFADLNLEFPDLSGVSADLREEVELLINHLGYDPSTPRSLTNGQQ